jgi:hypothetical protein
MLSRPTVAASLRNLATRASRAHPRRSAVPAVALLASLAAACGSPTEPSPPFRVPQPPVAPAGPVVTPVSVIDGWTGTPVSDVRGQSHNAESEGSGEVLLPVACAPATFVAPGYLERRVRCLQNTVAGGKPVTLWPVRDERESLETMHAVFEGGMATGTPSEMPTYLTPELQAPHIRPTWDAAAAELRRLTGDRWLTLRNGAPGAPYTEDAYIVASTAGPSACDHPWYRDRVPFDRFGFCLGLAPGYFQVTLRVAEWRLTAPDVVLRTLLFASGAREHQMPGLLSTHQPAAELSEFERKTLHMVGLRGRIGWPDDELCPRC